MPTILKIVDVKKKKGYKMELKETRNAATILLSGDCTSVQTTKDVAPVDSSADLIWMSTSLMSLLLQKRQR